MLRLLRPAACHHLAARLRTDGVVPALRLHPQQLRSAYAVPPPLTGQGVTVAVVSSWRIPTAAQDITTFARQHGQPLRPGQFTQILPGGLDASSEGLESLGLQTGSEEVGDTEIVHDMAPSARIIYLGVPATVTATA